MSRSLLKRFKTDLKVAGLFGGLELTDDQETNLRAAQVSSIRELTNVSILACLLNVMVLVLSFSQTGMGRAVFAWGGVMCLVLGYMAFSAYRRRVKSRQQGDKENQTDIAAFVRAATILGVLWGLIALAIIPFSDSIGMTASGMLLVGTMFGGVLLIGRIPDAAMGLVIPIIAGVLVGFQLQQDPRNTLLSVMTLSYMGVLYFASRLAYGQFAQQQLSQIAMEEQTELIGLLLRDFEETTKDWLWQTDANGVLIERNESSDLEVGSDNRMPSGEKLLSLLASSDERSELKQALRDQRPFRDLTVRLKRDEAREWWSFSGKPVFAKGEFNGFRGVASDVTKSKITEDRMAFLAHYDPLTKLPNRETLTDELKILSLEAHRSADNHVLIWLDLDNFKWVNDTMGHHAGDALLQGLGDRLRNVVGPNGLMARISGDEFAVVLPFSHDTSLPTRLDEVCNMLGEPYQLWGSSILCRASMGVKRLPNGPFDVEEALKHADMALYSTKGRQKGTWTLFDKSLEDKAQTMRQLETDLNNAIEGNEMRVFFQPLVDATTHEVVGCETLLRWQHPHKGLLSPGAFIEFAEDTGVITRIGDWVLRQALYEAQRFPDHIKIAINLSPLQLHSESLVPTIVNSLATNGIAPNRVELELTESVLMTDTKYTLEKLRQLKDIGVRIALDDFGTGFSSLSYLRQFPFDKLKIDKSFTDDLDTSKDSRAITQATLQLAKALGMHTTGEGVETMRQGEFLRDNGCNELQGYFFSRPQPIENLAHLIELKPELSREQKPAPQRLVPTEKLETDNDESAKIAKKA